MPPRDMEHEGSAGVERSPRGGAVASVAADQSAPLPDPPAPTFAANIPSDAIADALSVGVARAAAQNQTLGNLRTRTAALLPTAAISVTFATSVGLLANDTTHGGSRMPQPVADALLVLVILIGVVTFVVQWPTHWDFDSGTDVYTYKGSRESAIRAAINQLETVVARNSKRLRALFVWFEIGVALLAAETALAVYGLIVGSGS